MKDHEVYILLMQTSTLLARIIQFISKEPYSHVSLALDKNLKTAYSFGRKNPHFMFPAGFVVENLEEVFRRYPDIRYALYALPVTKEEYHRIQHAVEGFKKDSRYRYNVLGAFGAWFNIPVTRDKYYFCSQFVADVLIAVEQTLFDKPAALVRPYDFRINSRLKPIAIKVKVTA